MTERRFELTNETSEMEGEVKAQKIAFNTLRFWL